MLTGGCAGEEVGPPAVAPMCSRDCAHLGQQLDEEVIAGPRPIGEAAVEAVGCRRLGGVVDCCNRTAQGGSSIRCWVARLTEELGVMTDEERSEGWRATPGSMPCSSGR